MLLAKFSAFDNNTWPDSTLIFANQCSSQSFRILTTTLGQFQHWCWQINVVGKDLGFRLQHFPRFNIDIGKSMLFTKLEAFDNNTWPDLTLILPNQCCWQNFRLLTTTLGQIQHWYWQINVVGKALAYWQQHLARYNIDIAKSMLLAKC